MKRPTRPFVVEVKKKRGSPAKPRSIWGDLDLSTVAGDPLSVPKGVPKPTGTDSDPIPVVENDRASDAGPVIGTPSEDGDERAIANANQAEAQPRDVATEGTADEPARSPRKRVRRRKEPDLPRGQRWKRRLPRALRR
jgi:hypothetical protein